MQALKQAKAESHERKAKLASSYHQLLEEFSSKDLQCVGNYEVDRLIGKGSFGKVYLAKHKLTNGSKVVLKSAKKDDSNLAREIHHHRQFTHPHITRLYEVIVTENLVWMVLEYCPGDELYKYVTDNGPLPVPKVQKIFTQLVGAVAYVHNMSCVHRDLKLENILFDKNENVKLCDFGFTREYEGKSNYLQTFCGTICYSAPEMLRGEKYAGEKVDVWSLGVILYALLCGELPFDDDDDSVTRAKILGSEPKWHDHLTAEAKGLIELLLSKRPLRRPSLPEILAHPFLAEHAPQQQAILKLQQPAPFTTDLEKEVLERMRSAGVNIDAVIEHVIAQRCDSLAGWWALLLEKEQRKQRRRERKQKERESERRASKRLSSASSRMGPTLKEVEEEGESSTRNGETTRSRGRRDRRSAHYPELVVPDLPGLPEHGLLNSPSTPPPPIEKDHFRSGSTSRTRRPIPPPKEGVLRSARSRGSTLQLVTSNPDLLNATKHRPRRRGQHSFLNRLLHWKHLLLETTKRNKSPPSKTKAGSKSEADLPANANGSKASPRLSPKSAGSTPNTPRPTATNNNFYPPPPRLHTSTPAKRQSLSPSPLTPHSSFRRSSGMRGRTSTSSSVSSVRSIHKHHHTHSKASSTSSNGSDILAHKGAPLNSRSPHHSVKVLPATPTGSAFPSNIRVVRQTTPMSAFNEGASWGSPNAPNLIYAKRKKTVFKGPMLGVVGGSPSEVGGRSRTGSHSRSASVGGRRSGEIIDIQEEDEEEEEVVEEVEAFSPVVGPGETVEMLPDIKPLTLSGTATEETTGALLKAVMGVEKDSDDKETAS